MAFTIGFIVKRIILNKKKLHKMRNIRLIILLVSYSTVIHGQDKDSSASYHLPKHYFSINPLNICLAQQAGITYEFMPGMFGFAVGTGYMYRNNTTWSDYFIVGPRNSEGKLGYYSGVYVIPQLNYYFKQTTFENGAKVFYVALRGVYRYMSVDSIGYVPWSYSEDFETYGCNKMVDRVNIYGAFLNLGMKFVHNHFLLDWSFGVGYLGLVHDMYISSHEISNHIGPVYSPPKHEVYKDQHPAFNVNLSIGGVF
jgi:hypothetical protein